MGQTLCPAPIQGCTGSGGGRGSSYPPAGPPPQPTGTPCTSPSMHSSSGSPGDPRPLLRPTRPPPHALLGMGESLPVPSTGSAILNTWGLLRLSAGDCLGPSTLLLPLGPSDSHSHPGPQATRGTVPWRPGPSSAVLHGLPLGPGRWGGPRCVPLDWLQEAPGEPAWLELCRLSPQCAPAHVRPFTWPLPSSPGFHPSLSSGTGEGVATGPSAGPLPQLSPSLTLSLVHPEALWCGRTPPPPCPLPSAPAAAPGGFQDSVVLPP